MIEQIRERFSQRNIQAFRSQLWQLDDRYNISIAHEIIRLCSLIQPTYKVAFNEADWLIQEANQKLAAIQCHRDQARSLQDALAHITDTKTLGLLYIPAFLASDLVLTSYDHNKFEQYKALTLVSVARLTFIGKHKSRIENICNDVRLFSRGDRESLAAYMPDIQVLDFPQLVAAFQELVNEEDNPDLPPPSIVNQLNHYRRPYEATLDYKDGYSRRSNTTTFTGSSKLETSEIKFLDDDSGDSLVELREIASHPTVSKQVWQTEDISSDVNRTISIVSTLSTSSNDYAANALHARAINARIQKKEMSLACDIESMTKFEIGAVINYCVTSILARDCIEKQAKALLIMLFTGNPFHLIKKLKARKNNKHQVIGFQRNHRVPSQKQRAEIRPLVANSLSSFWLPLPEMVCERLQSLTFRDISEDQLKIIIKHINRTHGTHITLTKVAAYIQQLFTHENIDPIYTALIKGTALNDIPALYYTRLSAEQLTQHYFHFLRYLSRFYAPNNNIFLAIKEAPTFEFYGSTLYFEESLLTTLFSSLHDKIYRSIYDNGITDSRTHNLITLYTQLVLALSSGYRPVTGWFGKREHLNLDTGDYWISDKESGFGDNSRVIVLPKKMVTLLRHYLDFCSTLAVLHSNLAPRLSSRYQHTLNSDEHLFFYRDHCQVLECTPSVYSQHIDSIFPIQPNWARHQIRTLFLREKIDPALISAWMGHYNQRKRALHSHSLLNRKQFEQVATVLNNYIEHIGIEVAPWEK